MADRRGPVCATIVLGFADGGNLFIDVPWCCRDPAQGPQFMEQLLRLVRKGDWRPLTDADCEPPEPSSYAGTFLRTLRRKADTGAGPKRRPQNALGIPLRNGGGRIERSDGN